MLKLRCLWVVPTTNLANEVGVRGALGLDVVWLVVDVVAGEGYTSGVVSVVGVGVKVVNSIVFAAVIDGRNVIPGVAIGALESDLSNNGCGSAIAPGRHHSKLFNKSAL